MPFTFNFNAFMLLLVILKTTQKQPEASKDVWMGYTLWKPPEKNIQSHASNRKRKMERKNSEIKQIWIGFNIFLVTFVKTKTITRNTHWNTPQELYSIYKFA